MNDIKGLCMDCRYYDKGCVKWLPAVINMKPTGFCSEWKTKNCTGHQYHVSPVGGVGEFPDRVIMKCIHCDEAWSYIKDYCLNRG